ncbi:MAG: hypothetical protein NTW97_08215 [Candidatus Krumholzibacteria bacterium]|nr:hypothetical protein [Candidatus Krumholzibacteria bacterium]
MKTIKTLSIAGALLLCCVVYSGTASGQAVRKQYVADIGAAFTQATVTKAQGGMLGLDLSAGKMFTNGLSVGFMVGYDVVSYQKDEEIYERLAIVPILARAKYYFTLSSAMQLHAMAGGGAYQTIPHLGTIPIGGVSRAELRPGGSIGVGFDWWVFGSQGLGAEFEYNFFDSGAEDLFSYFSLRLNYSIIKM